MGFLAIKNNQRIFRKRGSKMKYKTWQQQFKDYLKEQKIKGKCKISK